MIIWFNEDTGEVFAHNSVLTETEENSYHVTYPNTTLIVEGLPDKPEGFENPVLYLDTETETLTWVDETVEEEFTKIDPTQLDRIEAVVNDIAKNSVSWDTMAQAISEGVNEV